MEIVKYTDKYFDNVNKIYEEAFPKFERYMTLIEMSETKEMELYCLVEMENVYGFICTIMYKSSVYILYLAVNAMYRHNGYGSRLLKWCIDNFSDYNIYLNIDGLNKEKPDYLVRVQRLNFYLSNGFYLTSITSSDEYEHFQVLSTKEKVDLGEYTELDNYVTKVLGTDLSVIADNFKLPFTNI